MNNMFQCRFSLVYPEEQWTNFFHNLMVSISEDVTDEIP